MPGDDKVQLLIDKQEIYDALMRYCIGIDRGDLALVLSAFHDDALDNHIGIEERAVERFTRTVAQATSKDMITSADSTPDSSGPSTGSTIGPSR